MQVGMTGGDLEGGRDGARNAEVQKLKQLFYNDDGYEEGASAAAAAAAAEAEATGATRMQELRDLAELGLLRDLPIARFRFVLMPHQQAARSVVWDYATHPCGALCRQDRQPDTGCSV